MSMVQFQSILIIHGLNVDFRSFDNAFLKTELYLKNDLKLQPPCNEQQPESHNWIARIEAS